MYESIIQRLERESKRVKKIPVSSDKVRKAADSLSRIIPMKPANDVFLSKPEKSKKKHRIPIVKSTPSKLPSKRVNFDEDVPWL